MIYLSFTTQGHRIHKINKTLFTLLNQTYEDYITILNVEENVNIPREILDLQSDKFIINKTKDFGPITKLLPTLDFAKSIDDIIITVDDDIVYPLTLVTELMSLYVKMKDLSVMGIGKLIPLGFAGFNVIQGNIVQQYKPYVTVDVLEGYAGALYPRSCFGKDFKTYVFKAIENYCCKYHDDVVISYYMNQKDLRPRYVTSPTVNRQTILQSVLPYGNAPDALHLRDNPIMKTNQALSLLDQMYTRGDFVLTLD